MFLKKVLLFARDPGGANVIAPIYEKLEGTYELLLYAKEFAVHSLQAAGLPVKDLQQEWDLKSPKEAMIFLQAIKPEVLITGTSLDDFTERYLWKAAERLQLKAFAILDQWINLGIRFSDCDYKRQEMYHRNRQHPYLPYGICAMDALAKELLQRDGIPKDKIILTGQPHFDTVREKFKHAKAVYGKERWNIVFVSEPISQDYDHDSADMYWGYNEKTIFDLLYRCLEKLSKQHGEKIRVIIRPHPRENPAYWIQVLKKLKNENITLDCNPQAGNFSVMKSADLVCGMSSMFLLESVICRKPVLSIEIGLKRENPFVLDKTGQCKSILTKEELLSRLELLFLQYKNNKRSDSCRLPQDRVIGYPPNVEHAGDQILRVIEEEIGL